MSEILSAYRQLLSEVDAWFSRCSELYPDKIACTRGCSECCRSLFDITILDAATLKNGFDRLPEAVRNNVRSRAEERLEQIRNIWPEFTHPYTLNYHPEEDWQLLMRDDDETPCVLLDDNGHCLLYDFRPMTCRLHGLPLIDISGEVMHDEWCSNNFTGIDPLLLEGLRTDFDRILRDEVALDRLFTKELLGRIVYECDTLIPTALLIDFNGFDWRGWIELKSASGDR
jgi:Fe-S-cluster containining protein